MKKSIIIFGLLISSLTFFAQDIDLDSKFIRNTITSPDGGFFIINTDAEYPIKFWLRADGQVNWYLDGQDMFIRDGDFQSLGQYDFLHIDGTEGRIGFNILAGELPLTSSITLHGSIATRVRILDGSNSYAIKQDDHILIIDKDDNTTNVMELPAVEFSKGREYIFKRNGNNSGKIEVKPKNGEYLNGEQNGKITLNTDNSSLEVVCDGSGWWTISELSAVAQEEISTDITLGSAKLVEVIFLTDAPIVITLPDVVKYDGQRYIIKRNDATAHDPEYTNDILSIKPASGVFLDQYSNGSPYTMPNDWESVTIQSNGARWLILSNYGH